MGSRANYILKYEDRVDFHYSHSRADRIASDLFLGFDRFHILVKKMIKVEKLEREPQIEGCILLDFTAKTLLFWELEQLNHYSIRNEYLQRLQPKWSNWSIRFAEREMYEIEKFIDLDYTKPQLTNYNQLDIKELASDKYSDFVSSYTILKKDDLIILKEIYSIDGDELLLMGDIILDILMEKPSILLPKEDKLTNSDIVVIDFDAKNVYYNSGISNLDKELNKIWIDWGVITGNFSYIKLLKMIGYKTHKLEMSKDTIDKKMSLIIDSLKV